MNFEDQFKLIRKSKHMTQEDVATKLLVSRQTVSNWENGKNLPDMEMLVRISNLFGISLNELVMGNGIDIKDCKEDEFQSKNTENNISDIDSSNIRFTKKIVDKTIKLDVAIGYINIIVGIVCFLIKANSVEYIDSMGFLHENFYLIPLGFLCLGIGIVLLTIRAIKNRKENRTRSKEHVYS